MNPKNTKQCEIYFSKLENIKDNVSDKVKKMDMIPDDLIKEYQYEYANFSKCYFSKKLHIPGVKEHLLRTLEQINDYKKKISFIRVRDAGAKWTFFRLLNRIHHIFSR